MMVCNPGKVGGTRQSYVPVFSDQFTFVFNVWTMDVEPNYSFSDYLGNNVSLIKIISPFITI